MPIRRLLTLSFTCLTLLLPLTAPAEENSALAISAGVFDIGEGDSAAEFGVEYRFAPMPNFYDIIPAIGISGTSDGSAWIYSGIRYDIDLGENWVLTPNIAASLYHDGGGKDLDHTLEFRSGIELAYKINNNSHLGLAIYHMSNASLGDKNPGEESVILSYSFSPDF